MHDCKVSVFLEEAPSCIDIVTVVKTIRWSQKYGCYLHV